ncbi:MAG: ribonuclease H-like domain-containing protein, partial [Saprospiraceae bacterium]|nr:ribonuclease H-like domain-containing protein [Saprospiraceae bacterium]
MRLDRILFIDIETVPEYKNYSELPEKRKYFWARRARLILKKPVEDLSNDELQSTYFERSGIYAEFAKIVCISAGYFSSKKGEIEEFRTTSLVSDNEEEILIQFKDLLDKYFNNPNVHNICGHNIREFDVPVICRRMLIHKINFPKILEIRGKKPWEVQHLIDTMDLWKFGDRKSYTSLDLLAHVF